MTQDRDLQLELQVTQEAIKNTLANLNQHKARVETLQIHVNYLIEKRDKLKKEIRDDN